MWSEHAEVTKDPTATVDHVIQVFSPAYLLASLLSTTGFLHTGQVEVLPTGYTYSLAYLESEEQPNCDDNERKLSVLL